MTLAEAIQELYDDAEGIREQIINGENNSTVAMLLLNMFVINTSAMLAQSGAIEEYGDARLKGIADLISNMVNASHEELNARVNTLIMLSEVPAAAELFDEFYKTDGDNNG